MPNPTTPTSEFSKSDFERLLKDLRAERERRQNELDFADILKSAGQIADQAQKDRESIETLPNAEEEFKSAAREYQRAKDVDNAEAMTKQAELVQERLRHLLEVKRLINSAEALLDELESRQAKGTLQNGAKEPMLATIESLLTAATSLYPEARQIQVARERAAKFERLPQYDASVLVPGSNQTTLLDDRLKTLNSGLDKANQRINILTRLLIALLLFACVVNTAILGLQAGPLLGWWQTTTPFTAIVEVSATSSPMPIDTETVTVEPTTIPVIVPITTSLSVDTPTATNTPIVTNTSTPTETPTAIATATPTSSPCQATLRTELFPFGLRKAPGNGEPIKPETKEYTVLYLKKMVLSDGQIWYQVNAGVYGVAFVHAGYGIPSGCIVPEVTPTPAPSGI